MLRGHFPPVPCHSERIEEFEVCEWRMCNDLRFFAPLRMTGGEGALRMTGGEGTPFRMTE